MNDYHKKAEAVLQQVNQVILGGRRRFQCRYRQSGSRRRGNQPSLIRIFPRMVSDPCSGFHRHSCSAEAYDSSETCRRISGPPVLWISDSDPACVWKNEILSRGRSRLCRHLKTTVPVLKNEEIRSMMSAVNAAAYGDKAPSEEENVLLRGICQKTVRFFYASANPFKKFLLRFWNAFL